MNTTRRTIRRTRRKPRRGRADGRGPAVLVLAFTSMRLALLLSDGGVGVIVRDEMDVDRLVVSDIEMDAAARVSNRIP